MRSLGFETRPYGVAVRVTSRITLGGQAAIPVMSEGIPQAAARCLFASPQANCSDRSIMVTRSAHAMAFMDLRDWIALLEKEGELRRITAEVDWDREIGAITRRVLQKKGPALLFREHQGLSERPVHEAFCQWPRRALAPGPCAGFSTRRQQSRSGAARDEEKPRSDCPGRRQDGAGQGRHRRGDAIDQTEFPVPKWHYLEGGRYIHTFSCIVTRDPETRVMNVGIYRGMIGQQGHRAVPADQGRPALGQRIS